MSLALSTLLYEWRRYLAAVIALALAEKVGSMGAAEFFAERGKNGDVDWAIEFLESRPE